MPTVKSSGSQHDDFTRPQELHGQYVTL